MSRNDDQDGTDSKDTNAHFDDALVFANVSKRFSGIEVLHNVNLKVARHSIHGLLGGNGSGKSTLLKCMSGYHTPDKGATLHVFGSPIELPVKATAVSQAGLAFVHQDLGLFNTLSIAENLAVPRIIGSRRAFINWDELTRWAESMLQRFGLSIPVDTMVGALNPGEQAMVAIVRADAEVRWRNVNVSVSGAVLVLDEPTAFLGPGERRQLFDLLRLYVNMGSSVVIVSHDLADIAEIADELTILRDGRVVGTGSMQQFDTNRIVQLMAGDQGKKEEEKHDHSKPLRPQLEKGLHKNRQAKARITVDNVTGGQVCGVAFQIAAGEIVGITGLLGSGADEVPMLLFGGLQVRSGRVCIGDSEVKAAKIHPSTMLKLGMAFVPGDRIALGGFRELRIDENLVSVRIRDFMGRTGLRWRRIRQVTLDMLARYQVVPQVADRPFATLSGGNQQKVIIAKWLLGRPSVLVIHEPTHGVDVLARKEIHDRVNDIANSGVAVLLVTTDLEELVRLSNRVLVMKHGAITKEIMPGGDTAKIVLDAIFEKEQ